MPNICKVNVTLLSTPSYVYKLNGLPKNFEVLQLGDVVSVRPWIEHLKIV